ncbi:hypothetical protein K1T71_013645 [Dendrolimus kikuchii]|uniref:Uncharacterized protein n=1 Tax=Dendrolimus kikuchii TaxID=765133 RepID=A0ACC1CH08_9NEOP|nr:hypothetical protein K1T71_013645 [Dendrolimus kikuchii]
MDSLTLKFIVLLLILIVEVIPIQLSGQDDLKENNLESSELNQCLSVERGLRVGACFGKEVLNKLNTYEEADAFSLATGVAFVRDDKAPRDIGSFLDKDPMDFRAIIEDASNLISKRSLHWDLSVIYPGLVMRIGPTLANGVLEFIMDPRIKDTDRAYHQSNGELTTGRLLARNLLVPFLLGFKFQLSTLLPLLLGLLLIASKKAFLLAKFAVLAVTAFSGSGLGASWGGYGGPALSSYSSHDHPVPYHDHHSPDGKYLLSFQFRYYRRQPHHHDYYYREKSTETSTASPITPDELRDRLERFFVTKKNDEPSDDAKIRNARNFAWTPINTG